MNNNQGIIIYERNIFYLLYLSNFYFRLIWFSLLAEQSLSNVRLEYEILIWQDPNIHLLSRIIREIIETKLMKTVYIIVFWYYYKYI